MGTPKDLLYRTQNIRSDDAERRDKILKARDMIHNQGYVVNSAKLDIYLKDQSLVPTEVRKPHLFLL